MAFSENTGFKGLYIDEAEKRLLSFDPANTGFEGLFIDKAEKRLLQFNPFKTGFSGLILSYQDTDRFLKITDFRGNGVSGVEVKVENTGGTLTYLTDSSGFVTIQPDVTGTKTIRLSKNKTFASFTYTYASEGLNRTVVFMPRLLE